MGLRLYSIVFTEGHGDGLPDGASLIPFRDLAAVVEEGPYELDLVNDETMVRYRTVVDGAFRRGAVLPTPPGTVFRTRQALEQWLELHYVALSDALAFLDDRVEARVHVRRAEGEPEERDAGTDLAAVSAEVFRVLRRQAVASVGLRTEHLTGIAVSSAFLVERELWKEFTHAVEVENGKHDDLTVQLSGPWAPYDFVRMQFGG